MYPERERIAYMGREYTLNRQGVFRTREEHTMEGQRVKRVMVCCSVPDRYIQTRQSSTQKTGNIGFMQNAQCLLLFVALMNASQAESLRTILSYSPSTPSHSEQSVSFGSVPENKMEPGTPLYYRYSLCTYMQLMLRY